MIRIHHPQHGWHNVEKHELEAHLKRGWHVEEPAPPPVSVPVMPAPKRGRPRKAVS